MLEIRYLRHILSLAKYGNFHKAAEAVNISQPALTKSIRKSETLLGEQLFEREANNIKPTRFGEYVIKNAETLMGKVEKFTDEITTFKEDFGNSFRIGIHPFFTAFVTQALTNILPNNTDVCFDFKILGHLEAVEKLRDHQIDFYLGVIRNDYALQYSEIRFKHFPIPKVIYVVRGKHPLAEKKKVLGKDLLGYDWLALDNQSTLVYKRWLMEALALDNYHELQKRGKVIIPDYSALKEILTISDYIAIMPKPLVQNEISKGLLKEIKPQWRIPHIKTEGFIMFLETYVLHPVADTFFQSLQSVMGKK